MGTLLGGYRLTKDETGDLYIGPVLHLAQLLILAIPSVVIIAIQGVISDRTTAGIISGAILAVINLLSVLGAFLANGMKSDDDSISCLSS